MGSLEAGLELANLNTPRQAWGINPPTKAEMRPVWLCRGRRIVIDRWQVLR